MNKDEVRTNALTLSKRIAELKLQERDSYSKKMFQDRKVIFERILNETETEPRVLRIARCLSAFLREKEVIMRENDLLAGHAQFCDCIYSNPGNIDEEILYIEKDLSDEDRHIVEQFHKGARMGLFYRAPGGHVIAGYDRILALLKLSVYIFSVPLLFIIIAYVKLQYFHLRFSGMSTLYSLLIKDSHQLTIMILCIAFALLGIFRNSLAITRTYLALEFGNPKLQTSYYGITLIIQQAAMAIAGLAVGLYIDKLEIPGVILIGIAFHLCAIGYAYFNLRDPRTKIVKFEV